MTTADVEAFRKARRESDEQKQQAGAQPNGEAKPEWPEPEELGEWEDPQPYPLDALPHDVKDAVAEYQRYGMQPIALVATCALAAMGSAVQGLVDVKRESTLKGSVSLCTIIIAQSGERKTACDLAFGAAAEKWAREERERIEKNRRDQLAVKDKWEATRQRLLSQIRSWKKKAKPAAPVAGKDAASGEKREAAPAPGANAPDVSLEDLERELKEHYRLKPTALPSPLPRFENHTIESVAKILHETWPSVGWASNEGAMVVGGHSFRDEGLLQTLGFLSALGRRTAGPGSVERGLLRDQWATAQRQPHAAAERVRGVHRGGQRGCTRAGGPVPDPAVLAALDHGDSADLEAFLERAEQLYRMRLPMPFDMANYAFKTPGEGETEVIDQLELRPTELYLSADARRQWIRYANECESQLVPEGEAVDVKDVAAKSAENACRLAAIFRTWQHGPEGEIDAEDMLRGITLARWYLYEARRVLGSGAEHPAAADAQLLTRWVGACHSPPSLRDVLRLAPCRLRNRDRRDAAIELLTKRHWLKLEKHFETTVLVLNPTLPWEG